MFGVDAYSSFVGRGSGDCAVSDAMSILSVGASAFTGAASVLLVAASVLSAGDSAFSVLLTLSVRICRMRLYEGIFTLAWCGLQ